MPIKMPSYSSNPSGSTTGYWDLGGACIESRRLWGRVSAILVTSISYLFHRVCKKNSFTNWKISAVPPADSMPLFSASASFWMWPYTEYYGGEIVSNNVGSEGLTYKHNCNSRSHGVYEKSTENDAK